MPYNPPRKDTRNRAEAMRQYRSTPEGAKAFAQSRRKYEQSAKGKMTGKRLHRTTRLARYGLTHEAYTAMFKAQGGLCAICRNPQHDSAHVSLAVDHDHKTEKVRALLCTKCNMALGAVNDDIDLRSEMIAYVVRHGE